MQTLGKAGMLGWIAAIALAHGVARADTPPHPTTEVRGSHFKLVASLAAECKAGAECALLVKLEAEGEFHINKSYPYKFKANDAAGVEFLGKTEKNVFSKAAGDFKEESEKVAVMTVRFKPAAKGSLSIGGQFKLSVCSEQSCQLETQEISAPVVVK